MVQNHLLELLCIVAMEPIALDADDVRDEKLKVLARCLRKMTLADVKRDTVAGQYTRRKRRCTRHRLHPRGQCASR
jgi:glucose-6-phosphate 1-dehydrogenase